MMALSLWQPYASLIAIGAKPFETRSWAPPPHMIGQRIAIHASQKLIRETLIGVDLVTSDRMGRALFGDRLATFDSLPFGAVVCTAVLAGAYACGAMRLADGGRTPLLTSVNRSPLRDYLTPDLFGDYSPGRWAWWLRDVEPVDPPVKVKGHQKFWPWTP